MRNAKAKWRLSVAMVAALGAVVVLGSSSPPEAEPACVLPLASDIAERHDELLRAIAAGRLDAVLAHYGADAIFMGVDTPTIRLGRSEVRSYYQRRLRTPPQFVVIERSMRATCHRATESGVKLMSIKGDVTPPQRIRFIVHYALANGRWEIIHHHAERLETPSDPAVASALPAGRVGVTGSLPARSFAKAPLAQIELPPPAFQLPAAPPVIVTPGLRYILTPSGAVPRPLPEPPVAVAEPIVPRVISPSVSAQATAAKTTPVTPAVLPAPEIRIPPLPFAALLEPPRIVAAARTQSLPAVPPVVSHLRLPDGLLPPLTLPPLMLQAPTPSIAVAAPAEPASVPAAGPPAAPTNSSPAAPAVAGFTQRAPDVTAPPAKAARAPKRATAPANAAPKASSGYRAGRWADGVPVYD